VQYSNFVCTKRDFSTQEEAQAGIPAVQILNDSKGKRHRKDLHTYFCEDCCAWHIGHRGKYEYKLKQQQQSEGVEDIVSPHEDGNSIEG